LPTRPSVIIALQRALLDSPPAAAGFTSPLTLHLNLIRNLSQWHGPSQALLDEAAGVAKQLREQSRQPGLDRLLAKMELHLRDSESARMHSPMPAWATSSKPPTPAATACPPRPGAAPRISMPNMPPCSSNCGHRETSVASPAFIADTATTSSTKTTPPRRLKCSPKPSASPACLVGPFTSRHFWAPSSKPKPLPAAPGKTARTRFSVINPGPINIAGHFEIQGPGAEITSDGKTVSFTAGEANHHPCNASPHCCTRSPVPLRFEYYQTSGNRLLAIDANGNGDFTDPGGIAAALIPIDPPLDTLGIEVRIYSTAGESPIQFGPDLKLEAEVYRNATWVLEAENILK